MKKNYILSVIGVLLVVGIGVSFAYFVSDVLFSGEGSSVTLEPGDMIRVTYDAGSGSLNTEGMIPGDSTSKDFTVTVTPTETEKEVKYAIILNITENTFVKCDDSNYDSITNACSKDADELVYRLKDNDNQVIAEGSLMSVIGELKLITETKTVDTQTTYNYTLEIEFIETGYDQNHNQNKTFNGNIEVEFSGPSAKDYILANSEMGEGTPDFVNTSCTSGCGEATVGIYEATDNLGTSYYYRGDVENNYVSFAGYYWRIIRINGDGSIRIIYDGTSAHINGESSTDRQISTSVYNSSRDASYYVGYTYVSGYQRPSLASDTEEGQDSTIKKVLDQWYSTNIANQGLDDKVVSSPGFCNDREMASGYNWSANPSTTIEYAANERLWTTNKMPMLECGSHLDLYTTKIGLITADEVSMAGGVAGTSNSSYYLYIGNAYWTMTPAYFNSGGNASIFDAGSNGGLGNDVVYYSYGVRPVINLRADVTLTGTGTATDPYVVV